MLTVMKMICKKLYFHPQTQVDLLLSLNFINQHSAHINHPMSLKEIILKILQSVYKISQTNVIQSLLKIFNSDS